MTTQLKFERTQYENTNGKQVMMAETINFSFEYTRHNGLIVLNVYDDNGLVTKVSFIGENDVKEAQAYAQQMENKANNNN